MSTGVHGKAAAWTARRRAWAAIVLVTASPMVQAGGLDSMLDGMFVQVTHPGAYQSQSRLGLVGGDVSLRIPTRNIDVASFDPPRLSAGCSGIDMHGGSFGFINAQELVAVLRGIVQGAVAALFKMAINSISSQLGSAMSEFSQAIRELNSMFKNSCMVGEALFNAAKADDPQASFEAATGLNKKYEAMKSHLANGWDALLKGRKASDSNKIEEWDDNQIAGNVVWRAIVKSGSHRRVGNLGGTDNSMVATLIMNMTGSQITLSTRMQAVVSGGACPDGTSRTIFGESMAFCAPPAQMVTAVPAVELMSILRQPRGKTLHLCDDGADVNNQWACQVVKPVEVTTQFEGTDAYVERMLFGSRLSEGGQVPGQLGGMVGQIVSGQPISDDIKRQLSGFRTPTLRYLLVAQRQPEAVVEIARTLKPILSNEMAVALGKALIQAARVSYVGPPLLNISRPTNYDANINAFAAELGRLEGAMHEQVAAANATFEWVRRIAGNSAGLLPAPAGAQLGLGVR